MDNQDAQINDFNDEILVLDESGAFKVFKNGELQPYSKEPEIKVKSEINSPTTNNNPSTSLGTSSQTTMLDTGMEEPMLQPPPPMIRKQTANFYFHPEDEEEAAKFKTINNSPSGKRYSLEKIIYKIMENYQLDIKPEPLSRFKNIVFSFLRDRRALVDTQEALSRAKESGGLSFPMEQAGKVVAFLKEIKEKINAENGLVVDENAEDQLGKLKNFKPLAGVQGFKPIPRVEEAKQLPILGAKAEDIIKANPDITKVLPKFQRPIKTGTITDVKKDYKLVGPIEELANLSLEIFRMLGQNTKERAAKILNRVELLGETSLTKKAAGINAWRSSPLYKMYLVIGQASLEHGVNVGQIIQQSQQANKDILTLEEFEAISDVNKSLRF